MAFAAHHFTYSGRGLRFGRTRPLVTEGDDGATARTPWRWAFLGGVLGMLVALLLWFPAHWATDLVADASGQQITLRNVQGTLWKGSGVVVLTGGAGSREAWVLPGRLHWRLRPGWLPVPGAVGEGRALALQAALTHDGLLRHPARIVVARRQGAAVVGLESLDWQGPAGVLRGLGTPWNTLAFEGSLQVLVDSLQLVQSAGGWRLNGQVVTQAEDVSSRISTVRPLGSYRMEFLGGVDGTQIRLSTLGGPLELRGEGAFIGGQLRFQGSARAEPERREALGNVLNLIGNRNCPVALRILR